jgi:hypothetical protein
MINIVTYLCIYRISSSFPGALCPLLMTIREGENDGHRSRGEVDISLVIMLKTLIFKVMGTGTRVLCWFTINLPDIFYLLLQPGLFMKWEPIKKKKDYVFNSRLVLSQV